MKTFFPYPDSFPWSILFVLVLASINIVSAQNPDFDYAWGHAFEGIGDQEAFGMHIDPNGDLLVSGIFEESPDFDPGSGTTNHAVLGTSSTANMFLNKYNDDGDYIWGIDISIYNGSPGITGPFVTTDDTGNVYLTGYFEGTIDFTSFASGGIYYSLGRADGFLAKYDSNGNFLWAFTLAGTDDSRCLALETNGLGQVILIGDFEGTVDFDGGAGTTNLTTAVENGFMACYSTNGQFVWAKALESNQWSTSKSIGIGDFGEIFIAGEFSGTADLAPGPTVSNAISNGSTDIFLARYDFLGNLLWQRSFGSSSFDYVHDLQLHENGKIYITGRFNGDLDFDPGPGTTLNSPGTTGAYLSSFDTQGDFLWVNTIVGSSGLITGSKLTIDPAGRIILAGRFRDLVDFDPGAGAFNLNAGLSPDMYLAVYDSLGSFIWAGNMGGNSATGGIVSLISAPDGALYFAGRFAGIIDFDPTNSIQQLGAFELDMMLVRLNSCVMSASANILDPISCNGSSDGSIGLSVQNGHGSVQYLWSNGQTTAGISGLGPGTYSVQVTDSIGCSVYDTIALSEPSLLQGTTLATPEQMGCDGTAEALVFGGTPPYTYQWDAAANNQTNAIAVLLCSGTYCVTVTDANGCTWQDCSVQIISDVTEAQNRPLVELYPNPAADQVYLRGEGIGTQFQIEIFDLAGQLMICDPLGSNPRTPLNIARLPSGIYLYRIHSENQILRQGKLRKQ